MIVRLVLGAALAAAPPLWVGRFSGEGAPPPPWRVVRLDKDVAATLYRRTRIDGVDAVEARADSAMALLARPLAVDLAASPVLCWRWRVDAPVAQADMRRRSGDDYAARVYVTFDMPDGALGLAARLRIALGRRLFGSAVPDAALNYVWDNRNPVGTRRRSAYTDRVEMIVAETGSGRAGQWVAERADVAADFARAFGNRSGRPIQLAIAADTDNTNGRARSAFADLHFVARGERCAA
ncbi:MAG TPA: DUF3047 domain-containing protein [Allosphingosinicella sp.]|nr:DUF3047 domain-containing protein [Allosphingosinicella sp.]